MLSSIEMAGPGPTLWMRAIALKELLTTRPSASVCDRIIALLGVTISTA